MTSHPPLAPSDLSPSLLSSKRGPGMRMLLVVALAAALPMFAGVAQGEQRGAQYERGQRHEGNRHDRSGQRPMREAIGEVEQNYRGHVVDVQSLRQNTTDEDVYRMRVLQRDGRVKTVTVPAKDQRR